MSVSQVAKVMVVGFGMVLGMVIPHQVQQLPIWVMDMVVRWLWPSVIRHQDMV